MVICRISGGLGNQMFQYAFARRLTFTRGDRILIETSQLRGRPRATPRSYGLGMFELTSTLACLEHQQEPTGVAVTISQQRDGFHPEALAVSTSSDLILQGFWTSEKYFSDIAPVIRSDFSFKQKRFRYENERLAHDIPNVNAICVHVRRGDYVSTPNHFMGFVGLPYYQRAIEFVAARVHDPYFCIVSDEIEWCVEHLRIDHAHTFVQRKQSADSATEEDFRLMRACRHFIIANSTFSWWAAWLSATVDTVVVVPSNWYAQKAVGTYKLDATHLVPPHWIRL